MLIQRLKVVVLFARYLRLFLTNTFTMIFKNRPKKSRLPEMEASLFNPKKPILNVIE
jgi:hypothetical protein